MNHCRIGGVVRTLLQGAGTCNRPPALLASTLIGALLLLNTVLGCSGPPVPGTPLGNYNQAVDNWRTCAGLDADGIASMTPAQLGCLKCLEPWCAGTYQGGCSPGSINMVLCGCDMVSIICPFGQPTTGPEDAEGEWRTSGTQGGALDRYKSLGNKLHRICRDQQRLVKSYIRLNGPQAWGTQQC